MAKPDDKGVRDWLPADSPVLAELQKNDSETQQKNADNARKQAEAATPSPAPTTTPPQAVSPAVACNNRPGGTPGDIYERSQTTDGPAETISLGGMGVGLRRSEVHYLCRARHHE